MSTESKRFEPDLPVLPTLDTEELLEHSTGVWGDFAFKEDRFGLQANEIPGIAHEWVDACNAALRGAEIVNRMVKEHTLILDLNAVKWLSILTGNFSNNVPYEKRIKIIERSTKAFSYLIDPAKIDTLTQRDVDAAQLLLSKLNTHYEPRDIKAPAK